MCSCCIFCLIRLIEAATVSTDRLHHSSPMIFWILATTVTLIALAALYYASRGSAVNASALDNSVATEAHFRAQLSEIEADIAGGRLSGADAEAAKSELARELLRLQSETGGASGEPAPGFAYAPLVAMLSIAVLSFVVYTAIGNPDLPSLPLASRATPETRQVNVSEAIARVEAQLEANPDDARGWSVLGPVYMQSGRYDDAVTAFRHILELLPPSADAETDLAEAIMMANNGVAEGEPLELLKSAAARDPSHIRSRFYLAGEATRTGDFENAVAQWNELLALGTGDEPWIAVVRDGLAAAEAGLRGEPLPAPSLPSADTDQQEMIRGMVEGLSERLAAGGGTVGEWTQLVRARLVLGERDLAQAAYDAAKLAYPDAGDRAELDGLANEAGLE